MLASVAASRSVAPGTAARPALRSVWAGGPRYKPAAVASTIRGSIGAEIKAKCGPVAAGVLLSFNGNTLESHRLAGIYAGRLLKGEKPAELPIQTTSKGERS